MDEWVIHRIILSFLDSEVKKNIFVLALTVCEIHICNKILHGATMQIKQTKSKENKLII